MITSDAYDKGIIINYR